MKNQFSMSEEEFRLVVKEYYNKVFRLSCRYFGNRDDANDAVQEILVKLWANWDKFRGESARSTWVFRIATNVCLTFLKKTPSNTTNIEDCSIADTYDCFEDTIEEQDNQDNKIKFFHCFMGKMNKADRLLMNLYLENIDSKEIASIIGISDINVRTRIHRIKNQIKKEWEEQYESR